MALEIKPLRVCLVGYGFAGRTFHTPLIGATSGLDLAVVASSDADKVHADLPDVKVIADPMRAVTEADVDLVVIASPNATHAPLARAAMVAGRHVVVDKPFTLDLAEARELAALAQRHHRLLSVFQNRRWDSDFLGVKQAIDDELLGEVTHFESHIDRFRPQVRDRWREHDIPGGGLWYDLGPHLVDQALQLFGLPQRVWADMARQRHGAHTVDWAHVVLDYDRLRAILHAGMLVAGGSARFTVHGTRGSLVKRRADPQEDMLRDGMAPGAPGWGEDPDELWLWDGEGREQRLSTPAGDQRRYYAEVCEAIRGDGSNPVPPAQAVAVMAVLEAATDAANSDRAMPLALSAQERDALG